MADEIETTVIPKHKIQVGAETEIHGLGYFIHRDYQEGRLPYLVCVGAKAAGVGVTAVASSSQHTAPLGYVFDISPRFEVLEEQSHHPGGSHLKAVVLDLKVRRI